VVDDDSLVASLKSFDLDRAALFTRLHVFWERRATELKQSVKELLKVEEVSCDTSTGTNAQRFVLWADITANKYGRLCDERELLFRAERKWGR